MPIDRFPTAMPMPLPGAPPNPSVPIPERFVLDNGLRVVAVARSDLPQVGARLVVPAGAAADLPGLPGVASLTASLLTEGTARRSAVELNERIDGLGATICARAGHDFAEVDLGSLAEMLDEGLELMAEVVTEPAFPDREVERIRAEVLDALDARQDEPANVADDRAAAAVFGADHPYGRLPIGTPSGVRAIPRSAIEAFHGSRYRPEGCVLVIAGDLDLGSLRHTLERCFGRWAGSVDPVIYPPTPRTARDSGTLSSIDWEEGEQGEIRFGGIGIPRRSPDWIPAAVANYILGGNTITGRLGANLREDKGWTYGVRSAFSAGIEPAGWSLETAVDAAVSEAAIAEIAAELRRMVSVAVDPEELERAKEALILSLPRAFETPGRIVARLATLEAFDLPRDYWQDFPSKVANIDASTVMRIAAEQFDPDRLARVVVRPPASPIA